MNFSLPTLLAGLLVSFLLAGCTPAEDNKPAAGVTAVGSLVLKSVGDCNRYKTYLADSVFKQLTDVVVYVDDIAAGSGPEANENSSASPGSDSQDSARQPDGVSGTNIQEAGVDEADLVKADSMGNLYTVQGNYLLIHKAFPASQLAELSRLELGARASSLYLDEDGKRLVILANTPYYFVSDSDLSSPPVSPAQYRSQIIFVDVSDPEAPAITRKILMDSTQLNSRRMGNRVHLVSQYTTRIPVSLYENTRLRDPLNEYIRLKYDAQEKARSAERMAELETEIRSIILQTIRETDTDELLPQAVREEDGQRTDFGVLACENISRPETITSPGLLILSSFNLDGSQLQSTAITSMGWQIYASRENLYIAQNSSWWWDDPAQSVIHKFAVSGTKPEYRATAVVDGWIRNQFSMSEYEGYLRVVTSWSRFENQSRVRTNELFVLQDDTQGNMKVVGEVRGFGKDETVFSSRFLGDRGFVVTFRQIDPLFTFDLSDPLAPKLVGEVEIPGFSTYMQPLTNDYLLTIGRSGDMSGAGRNIQLQIFDVSDLASPQLRHKISPTIPADGYVSSEALYNHLAFTYYAPKKLLVIPLGVYSQNRQEGFNGFALFDVDIEGGFTEMGRTDFRDLSYNALCVDVAGAPVQAGYSCEDDSYLAYAYPRRSVIMTEGEDTFLYGIYNTGIKAVDTRDPATSLGSIVFPAPEPGF